jgi:YVTN family beta-propeller protein
MRLLGLNRCWRCLALAFLLGVARAAEGKSFVFVSNTEAGTISVIDPSTNMVASTIDLAAGGALGIAVKPNAAEVYVGTPGAVSVIDTRLLSVATTIPVGLAPREIAFTPDGSAAYVTDQGTNSVWVIDTATRSVFGSAIPVDNGATAIAMTPDGHFAYVVNVCGAGACDPVQPSTVSIIDTSTRAVVASIIVGYRSNGIAISRDGSRAYVANQCGADASCTSGGSLSVIDIITQTVMESIPIGEYVTQFVALDDAAHLVYVSNTCGPSPAPCGAGSISVVDTTTGILVGPSIPVGIHAGGLAIVPDEQAIYVANQSEDTVTAISTATKEVLATVPVGNHPAFVRAVQLPCGPVSSGCLGSARSQLLLNDSANDSRDKLLWKWSKGNALSTTGLGDPTATTAYALCVYAGATNALMVEAVIPPGAGWSTIGARGYRYNGSNPDGLSLALLKAGAASKSKAMARGKGTSLPDSTLPFAYPVTVQLKQFGASFCIEAAFTADDEKKNTPTQFRAKY